MGAMGQGLVSASLRARAQGNAQAHHGRQTPPACLPRALRTFEGARAQQTMQRGRYKSTPALQAPTSGTRRCTDCTTALVWYLP